MNNIWFWIVIRLVRIIASSDKLRKHPDYLKTVDWLLANATRAEDAAHGWHLLAHESQTTKHLEKWAAEKAAFAAGKKIEQRVPNATVIAARNWHPCETPQWFDNAEYRVKPEEKWTAEKAAFAAGKKIEARCLMHPIFHAWQECTPYWIKNWEYRIKPEIRPNKHQKKYPGSLVIAMMHYDSDI